MPEFASDHRWMHRAISLAKRGEGCVEPNPMVGCVIAAGEIAVGEGWHEKFGGPHAEIVALGAAKDRAGGATMFVSLEPCCHSGKTPPCTSAIERAGIRRVVVAIEDPFPAVQGDGIAALRRAGIEVVVGTGSDRARSLLAPYLKRVQTGQPWVIAKWAMTLDGKIATASGESQWISNERSRAIVHRLRGRVDAIVVGRETAIRDDPLLTARPPGPRKATRVVVDTGCVLPVDSRLVASVGDAPLIVAASDAAPKERLQRMEAAGVEVLRLAGESPNERLKQLLNVLGERAMTNVLFEGGGAMLGSLLDLNAVDEVHAFVAPKLVGGAAAPSAIAGGGIANMRDALDLEDFTVVNLDGDIYAHGRVARVAE